MVEYAILAIGFYVASISLTLKLRQHHPVFYKEHRLMLWIVTFALATPLMFRSLFDGLNLTRKWDQYFSDKTIIYNTVFFIVVDLFPILTQTTTLIFGVIRHRQ